jgi:hypothetical protein
MNDPVQHQLEAYNDRDLEAFMEAYAPDVRIEDGSGEEILSGLEAMRGFYESLFENSPNLRCEVVSRVSLGSWVIDEEEVSGLQAEGFPEEVHAAVAYRVNDGEIDLVRMFM